MLLRYLLFLLAFTLHAPTMQAKDETATGWPAPLTSEACWQVMPQPTTGGGQPLPTWARMLAREMPKTAAAFLELDLAQRTKSPVEPGLRAAMRVVAAQSNGSAYAVATARGDATRSGVDATKLNSLDTKDRPLWSVKERAALDFAKAMTVDSDSVTDQQFAELVSMFSEREVAAMVLAMAYANFQDRLLVCLGAPLEEAGPMAPVEVQFPSDAYETKPSAPPANAKPEIPGTRQAVAKDVVEDASPFTWLSYPQLQERLKKQRERQTRLPVPQWQSFADRLPKGLMDKPSEIVWYKIAFGYADQLAVPFEIYLRTAGSEIMTNWDRAFGNSIFWMVTDAVKCPYCMGHCEMNWEVVGMSSDQIAKLSQQLAGNDWSSFTESQQQALAFARKLTIAPASIGRADMDTLRKGFGDQRAFFIAVNASRYNYMTRISNGFQLTLESGNPFWDYYRMPTPEPSTASAASTSAASTSALVASSPDQPRATPLTRPEMKQMLEDMKARKERIPLPPLSEAEKSKAADDPRLSGYEGRLGQLFLPTTAGARSYLNFSGSPARISTGTTPARVMQEPDPALTLDYAFKTRLFWIASRVNNCQYCLGHQESKLLATGMSEDSIAALDNDWSTFPANEQAAFALARKITLEPHALTDADIDNCRKHFTDVQILEMILSVAGNNAINRWKEGVGVPQSAGGGNFGGSAGEAHSYLTETSAAFVKIKSKIVPGIDSSKGEIFVPTKMDRTSSLNRTSVVDGLTRCAQRTARLPLASETQTRAAFGDLVPASPNPIPAWMRLLANFPIAGKRQVASFTAAEKDLELSDLQRAQIAWVVARLNGAWYSLSLAQARMIELGQTPEQLAQIDRFTLSGSPSDDKSTVSSLSRKTVDLLLVAKHLAASPVILTDSEVEQALKSSSPKEVVQTVHYTAMRSLFDRMTEAASLSQP